MVRTLLLGAVAAVLAALCAGRASDAGPQPPIEPLVVFPSIDLAWGKADRQTVDERLYRALAARGIDLVPEPELLDFLTRHRLRYTGGVSKDQRERLVEELGARSVLLTSIDAFETEAPPRVALNAWIVSLPGGTIVWANEVALAGEQRRGALGRGEIQTVDALLDRALAELLRGVSPDAGTEPAWHHAHGRGEHRPKRVFRAPELDAVRERPARVCVLPFENQSPNPDAGDVLSGLFVTHLAGRERFEIVPPGDVRAAMLEGRVIQLEGLSLAQADFLRETLDADLAVTGRVLEYADHGAGTEPRVSFSVWVIDLRRRSVVWSGHSASRGSDGVVFFDVGRVRSARALAGAMVLSAADELASGKPASGGSKDER
jgi:hypothetical protein